MECQRSLCHFLFINRKNQLFFSYLLSSLLSFCFFVLVWVFCLFVCLFVGLLIEFIYAEAGTDNPVLNKSFYKHRWTPTNMNKIKIISNIQPVWPWTCDPGHVTLKLISLYFCFLLECGNNIYRIRPLWELNDTTYVKCPVLKKKDLFYQCFHC